MPYHSHISEIVGVVERQGRQIPIKILKARPYVLVVDFDEGDASEATEFETARLRYGDRELRFGRCRYEPHKVYPRRRQSDPPPEPGTGRLVFLDRVYDFRRLFRSGTVIELSQKLDQLPLLWRRGDAIKPSFRNYTARLIYDLQVYRALFDEIDRSIQDEPAEARKEIQDITVRSEYSSFCKFFDEKLTTLQDETRGLSKQESEQHGFYFRKQVWDIILTSEFLARTNLKPRGYAGDSLMMRMLYENEFRGGTIFSRFMHRHPIETHAAEAVRNRRGMIAKTIAALHREHSDRTNRLQVLSVACGPAWELRDLFRTSDDFDRFEFVLLDQDIEALGEAEREVHRIQEAGGRQLNARIVRESVRTMLRTRGLTDLLGQHHFLYSMGLFDYLTRPVAKAVMRRLYELLLPGGEMVIGNFHAKNPTRRYMEYWMDWVLFYREEDEFLELAKDLPGAECNLTFEKTHSQMFLRVRKS